MLSLLLRSILNLFQFSLANFATSGATASQVSSLFWKAVCISELNGVKILDFTCDGASSNRTFSHCMLLSQHSSIVWPVWLNS